MAEPPRLAPLDEVTKFAADLETAALRCWTKGHLWDDLTCSVREESSHTLHETIDCRRCGLIRTFTYVDGYVERRQYDYPKEYRRKGMGRIDTHGRALMRVEMFRRMVGD